MSKRIFLGGTCNGSAWRDELIPHLKVAYFNPVVADWTPECMQKEIEERQNCDVCLYVITPKLSGLYSIAEVIDDSNKRPNKTIFYFIISDDTQTFNDHQIKSIKQIGKMVEDNGGKWAKDYNELIMTLNN